MAVKGFDTVMRNLKKEISNIEGKTLKGVLKAALFVKGESQEITPVSPKGAAQLFGSAFTDVEVQSQGPVSRVGYTQEYAAFVHEMPATNNFTKPDTGPKFLEKAVKNNIPTIVKIIAKEARVK